MQGAVFGGTSWVAVVCGGSSFGKEVVSGGKVGAVMFLRH